MGSDDEHVQRVQSLACGIALVQGDDEIIVWMVRVVVSAGTALVGTTGIAAIRHVCGIWIERLGIVSRLRLHNWLLWLIRFVLVIIVVIGRIPVPPVLTENSRQHLKLLLMLLFPEAGSREWLTQKIRRGGFRCK